MAPDAPTEPARAAEPPRPTVAVSMGDPGGIGPEVLVKALADPVVRGRAKFLICGSVEPMGRAAERAGIEPFWGRVPRGAWGRPESAPEHDVVLIDDGTPATPARACLEGGAASFRWVEDAIALAQPPEGDAVRAAAIVTAPISKESWALAGHGRWPGHTELLGARFGVERIRMMFVAPGLRVVLATAHIPLMAVAGALTIGRIQETIEIAQEACVRFGILRPRIAVCGLNPHAGEGGLLGEEDGRVIVPALERARVRGLDVSGPHPADTVFGAAVAGRYDVVVAMYHDQGLIPVKLLAFDRAVNVTVGLPVVRTSPDHGTAFDIAGKNLADPGSVRAALELAADLSAAGPAQSS